MLTKIQKWGNALALRIPETSLALDAQLKNNSLVEVLLIDGKLVIKPLFLRLSGHLRNCCQE